MEIQTHGGAEWFPLGSKSPTIHALSCANGGGGGANAGGDGCDSLPTMSDHATFDPAAKEARAGVLQIEWLIPEGRDAGDQH